MLIAIGPSPPPHAARSLLAPQSKMVGECARRGNNGKKEEVASEQAGRRIAKHTHSTVGRSEGEKARRRLNGLTTFPLLLSSSHFAIAAAAAAAAVDSAVPFSPPSLPPSHFHLRSAACEPFFTRRRTLIGRGARSLPAPPTALRGPQRRSRQKRRKVRSPLALPPSPLRLALPPLPFRPDGGWAGKKGFGRRARGATSDAPTLDELAKISREIGIVGTSFCRVQVHSAQDAAAEAENGRGKSATQARRGPRHRLLLSEVISCNMISSSLEPSKRLEYPLSCWSARSLLPFLPRFPALLVCFFVDSVNRSTRRKRSWPTS